MDVDALDSHYEESPNTYQMGASSALRDVAWSTLQEVLVPIHHDMDMVPHASCPVPSVKAVPQALMLPSPLLPVQGVFPWDALYSEVQSSPCRSQERKDPTLQDCPLVSWNLPLGHH